MSLNLQIGLLVLLAFLAANLPFANQRLLMIDAASEKMANNVVKAAEAIAAKTK